MGRGRIAASRFRAAMPFRAEIANKLKVSTRFPPCYSRFVNQGPARRTGPLAEETGTVNVIKRKLRAGLFAVAAAVVGVAVPLIRQRLGYDPAVGSSVMITAVTDSGGFFIFLGLATLFLL